MANKNKQVSSYLLIAVGSAIVLGGMLTILIMKTFAKETLVVAAKNITPYSEPLTLENFKEVQISKGDKAIFSDFVTDINSLVGKVATSQMVAGQPIKSSQFIDPEDAEQVQTIVSSENNRGVYLNMDFENALEGEVKSGGIYDFYLAIKVPKPTASNPDNKEWNVKLFQKSYMVDKIITSDSSIKIFFEFPSKESEQYLLLKEAISKGDIKLIAVMPNPLHESYDGNELSYSEFYDKLISGEKYFSSISDVREQMKSEFTIDTNNDIDTNEDTETLYDKN